MFSFIIGSIAGSESGNHQERSQLFVLTTNTDTRPVPGLVLNKKPIKSIKCNRSALTGGNLP
jgi:hypothetical protein